MISKVIYRLTKQATRGRDLQPDTSQGESFSAQKDEALVDSEDDQRDTTVLSSDIPSITAPDVASETTSRASSPSSSILKKAKTRTSTRTSRDTEPTLVPKAIPIRTTLHTRSSPPIQRNLKRSIKDEHEHAESIASQSPQPDGDTVKKKTEDKRILRSQDTKPTSELLAYFPWLDDDWVAARKEAGKYMNWSNT